MRKIDLHVFDESDNTDTFKCPDCGSKVLVNTGYCVSCKKKVEPPKGKEKKEEEPDDKEKEKKDPEEKKEPEDKKEKKEKCKKEEEDPDDSEKEPEDKDDGVEEKKKKKSEKLMTGFKSGLYSASINGVQFHGETSADEVFGESVYVEPVSPEEFVNTMDNLDGNVVITTEMNSFDRRFWGNLEKVGVEESIVHRDNTFIIHRDVELKGTNVVLERGDVIRVL
jgi:signal recognition particle GTPase